MYKDILWIDDIDNSDSDAADLEDEYEEDISSYSDEMLSDEDKENLIKQDDSLSPYAQRIKLCRKMLSACHEIDTNYRRYNLVIFDMNMTKGWINRADDIKKLSEILSKNKINGYGYDTKEDEIAGIYLYLLLLNKGYPADRMIIYTGNSTDSLKSHFSYLKLDNIVKYKGDVKDTLDLETSYYPENSYYRIRRLVLQACDYWKKDIANKKDIDIPFNKIYFSKDTDKQISTENFKELLERVEMMFPVIQPASPEKVYYQAARILCEYHEESTKIQDIDQYIYPFHAVCRNFRNWSSHNKFHKAEMPADIFALLFCITLRTYFDFLVYYDKGKKEKISKFEKGYCAYEDVYNFKQSNNQKNDINLFGIIKSKLIKGSSLPLVLNRKTWKKSIPYSELVWLWGEDKNNRAHIHYILFPLVMKDYSMQFTAKPNNMKLNALSGENNLLNDDITDYCTYTDTGFMESAYKESCRICYENKDKE